MARARRAESLESAARKVIQAVLEGDGGTLYSYVDQDELQLVGMDRGAFLRLNDWAAQGNKGFVPDGPPTLLGSGGPVLEMTQDLRGPNGESDIVTATIQRTEAGPKALELPLVLSSRGMSSRHTRRFRGASYLERMRGIRDAYVAELPTLKSFSRGVRRGWPDLALWSWEERISGMERAIREAEANGGKPIIR
jgi:hypothetical protein